MLIIKNQRNYLESKLIIYLNLNYVNITMLILWLFSSQKNQKIISLLFIRLSQIFVSKKQVLMKCHSEKVRGTSVLCTEIVWLHMDDKFAWDVVWVWCWKSNPGNAFKSQSCYRLIRGVLIIYGFHLRKYSRSSKAGNAGIGITDWHTLTWWYDICLLIS